MTNDFRCAVMLATAQIVASVEAKGEVKELTALIEAVSCALIRSSDVTKAMHDGPTK